MSLRNVTKDHLADGLEKPGGMTLVSAGVDLPDHEDPLKFWTLHPKGNTFVDLTVFAVGQTEPRGNGGGKWIGAFSGRPGLIRQLATAIRANLQGKASLSVRQSMCSLRAWWRLLDEVERDAALAGQPVARVEDVRQLTRIHYSYAVGRVSERQPLGRTDFGRLKLWANLTLKSINARQLHNWNTPKNAQTALRLPPEDQCTALRIALKQEWYAVLRRWGSVDKVMGNNFQPASNEEADLLRHWRYFQDAQRRTGNALPSSDDLRYGIGDKNFTEKTRLNLATMRTIAFPNRWDVDTAFHQCLVNTGWNPSTLYDLDAATDFLKDSEWDPARYLLIGTKARAKGKEQVVEGLWKTKYGPGFIIKAHMGRTAQLRAQLHDKLVTERAVYEGMLQDGASADDLTRRIQTIQNLEAGCRSVWLYCDANGEINWLTGGSPGYHADGQIQSYLAVFLGRLNCIRKAHGEDGIPRVTQKDFRNMFALYVWRSTGGNILDVMAALNHAWLKTTDGYLNQHILNQERDATILKFLNLLFAQLGEGRLDLTILAHRLRYGAVTSEMELRLAEYRALLRPWPGIACKDPRHPPPEIHDISRLPVCSGERCLLCKANAVILPEALDFVARRVEELLEFRSSVPITAFGGLFADELHNGLLVLKLFPPEEVEQARTRWEAAIASGEHRVPGLRLHAQKEVA